LKLKTILKCKISAKGKNLTKPNLGIIKAPKSFLTLSTTLLERAFTQPEYNGNFWIHFQTWLE